MVVTIVEFFIMKIAWKKWKLVLISKRFKREQTDVTIKIFDKLDQLATLMSNHQPFTNNPNLIQNSSNCQQSINGQIQHHAWPNSELVISDRRIKFTENKSPRAFLKNIFTAIVPIHCYRDNKTGIFYFLFFYSFLIN